MPLINILKRSSDLVASFDKRYRIIHWNNSIEEHTGISRAEALGKSIYDILPGLKEHLGSIIEKQVFEEKTEVEYLHDLKLQLINGVMLHASAAVFPYHYIGQTSASEITGGVLLLYPFEKSAPYPPKLSKLLLSIPYYSSEAIIITEASPLDVPKGPSIVYVNRAFTEMTGYEEYEVLGKTPRMLQGPKTDRTELDRIKKALKEKVAVQAELQNYHKDGSCYWVGINIVPVKNEAGWTTHFIGVQRDITDKIESRRNLEKTVEERTHRLRQAVEDLEAFAYSASHDLKQPLRSVTSHLGLLKRKAKGKIDAELLTYIDEAVDGARRMYGLLEGVLQSSRITAVEDEYEMVDLQQLFARKIKELQQAYPQQRVEVELPEQPLPVVEGYEVHLEQVVQNLLSNAVKYCDAAVAKIQIAAGTAEGKYCISITDNGPGIPEEDRRKIFNLFSRNHELVEGTGIGLAICKRILQRHGGTIAIAPYEKEKGATFTFTLPKPKGPVPQPSQAE